MSCNSVLIETVYDNRDNTNDLLLKADGTAVDLSSVTRMVIEDVDGSFMVDEQTSPSAFDRDTGITGKVIISLGAEDITVGSYVVRLITYDPDNTSGVVWGGTTFNLIVI